MDLRQGLHPIIRYNVVAKLRPGKLLGLVFAYLVVGVLLFMMFAIGGLFARQPATRSGFVAQAFSVWLRPGCPRPVLHLGSWAAFEFFDFFSATIFFLGSYHERSRNRRS